MRHLPRIADLMLLAVLSSGATACDDASTPETGADAGLPLADVAPAPLPFALCDLALPANPAPAACETSADCLPTELCVGDGAGGAVCSSLCFPEDCAADSCGAGAECSLLALADGTPFAADVNGDGTEEPIGACVVAPAVTADPVAAWQPCPTGTPCEANALCVRLPSREAGICLPECGAYCVPQIGFITQCIGTNSGRSVCTIPCDPAQGVFACPESMACVTVNNGFALCTY
jgi:hypothetical protein